MALTMTGLNVTRVSQAKRIAKLNFRKGNAKKKRACLKPLTLTS